MFLSKEGSARERLGGVGPDGEVAVEDVVDLGPVFEEEAVAQALQLTQSRTTRYWAPWMVSQRLPLSQKEAPTTELPRMVSPVRW